MKKTVTILITLFLLTGCGNTITCKTEKGEVSQIYKIKYNNNDITNITTKKTYRFNTKEEQKNFEGIMQYTIKSNNNDNIKISYKKKNKKYILNQEYDMENISDNDLTQYGLNKNKDELINNLKNNGLRCK